MSYFAPYVDSAGIHMPTYEDRLENLADAYRSIFGQDAALTPASPDYQLLSVFAKALDDVSALVLQAYNSRNPAYATGAALDLMLPQYGLTRREGETDAELRNRIRTSLASRSACRPECVEAAVKNAAYVRDAVIYVNEDDAADARGIPGHSFCVVTRGGDADAVAQAIFDTKAPGIKAYGNTSGTATDSTGTQYTVNFRRYSDKMAFIYLFIRALPGADQAAISAAVKSGIQAFINGMRIGESLNVPQLYGVAYAADPALANTFVITDIQVTPQGASSVVRDLVEADWYQKISVPAGVGITVNWVT